MVRFEDDRFFIEVPGYGNPMETWSEMTAELIDVIGALDRDMINVDELRFVTWLLRAMMPDIDSIKK